MEEEQQLSLFDSKGKVINTPTEEMNKFAERLTNKGTKRNFLRSNKGRDKFLDAFNSYTESQQNEILDNFNKGKIKWGDMRQIVEGNAYAKSLEEQWESPIKKVEDNPLFKADDYIGEQQNLINPNYAEVKRNIKENVNSSVNSRTSSNFSTYIKKENDVNNTPNGINQRAAQESKRTALDGSSGKVQSSEDLSRKVAYGASTEEDAAQDLKVETERRNEKLSETLGASTAEGYQEPASFDPPASEEINTDNIEPIAESTGNISASNTKNFEQKYTAKGLENLSDKDIKEMYGLDIEPIQKGIKNRVPLSEGTGASGKSQKPKSGSILDNFSEEQIKEKYGIFESGKSYQIGGANHEAYVNQIEKRATEMGADTRRQTFEELEDFVNGRSKTKTSKSSAGHGKLAMAVGAVVGVGALVHALSDSRGQQSNAQLYGQQPIQY